MSDEGNWRPYGPFNQAPLGMELKVGPVFRAEVFFREVVDGYSWQSTLNGVAVARHKTAEEGMARVDWEICNRGRLMAAAYRVVKARSEAAGSPF